ncbi:helix-turn-helix transcriptional regulator [Planifilum fimeticola]
MVKKQLRLIRQKQNMTCKQVANEIGVTKEYYWQIENGKRRLSYGLAVKIARVFKKTPDEIFLAEELTNEEQGG